MKTILIVSLMLSCFARAQDVLVTQPIPSVPSPVVIKWVEFLQKKKGRREIVANFDAGKEKYAEAMGALNEAMGACAKAETQPDESWLSRVRTSVADKKIPKLEEQIRNAVIFVWSEKNGECVKSPREHALAVEKSLLDLVRGYSPLVKDFNKSLSKYDQSNLVPLLKALSDFQVAKGPLAETFRIADKKKTNPKSINAKVLEAVKGDPAFQGQFSILHVDAQMKSAFGGH